MPDFALCPRDGALLRRPGRLHTEWREPGEIRTNPPPFIKVLAGEKDRLTFIIKETTIKGVNDVAGSLWWTFYRTSTTGSLPHMTQA
jgi:hypothetical protein